MILADVADSPYETAPFALRGRCRINILGNNFVPGLRSRLHANSEQYCSPTDERVQP
jgi:hypothetical protein